MNNFKKILFYMVGLFLIALGVNISKLSGLGITPVTSIRYAIELGTASIIALQAVILGKEFKISSCLQFFCTFLIGFFINATSRSSVFLCMIPTPESYIYRFVLCIISCIIIGIGVYTYLQTELHVLPAEGLMLAICTKSGGKVEFHQVKIFVDISMISKLIF